jgi:hypothetical protein
MYKYQFAHAVETPEIYAPLTLTQMDGAHTCMTPKTLNRYNSKWSEVKNVFSTIYSSQNVLELLKVFIF